VIGGLEEARLVHLGVEARWPQTSERTVIVDVGGGSAQVVLSEHGRFVGATSVPLGAVRLTETFVQRDPLWAEDLVRMREHIRLHLTEPLRHARRAPIDRLIATSATAGAIVSAANTVKRSHRDAADRLAASSAAVRDLVESLAARDLVGRRGIPGIGRRRAEIVVAGAAVLDEILFGLQMPELHYSSAGVRDGIIADLARRNAGQDAYSAVERDAATSAF
jgi:exopolyphosphatase/guanosine-5'-triphosphate,3'-diphosphate pyrophosphatase